MGVRKNMSIQVLRGPSVSTDNPVLAEGQPYVDIQSNPPKLKIGDGQTNLNSLPYIGAEFASDVYRNDAIYPADTHFNIATADTPIFSLYANQIHVDDIYSESRDTIHLMNSILPTDITVNLGDASTRFNYIYGENIISNLIDCTNLTCGTGVFNSGVTTTSISTTSLNSTNTVIATYKPIIPMQDDDYSIGDSTHRFNSIHTNNLVLNSRTLNYQSDGYIHTDNTYLITKAYLDNTPLKGFSSTEVWPNANRVIISSSDSVLSASSITTTQLGYLSGVTSNIQTQLNGKAASSHSHSYLPLSGGTLTGPVTFNTTNYPNIRTGSTGNALHITIGSGTGNGVVIDSGWAFRPSGNGNITLGNGSHKWGQIYSTNSGISTSDRNKKHSIATITDKFAKDIVMGLNPVSYKFDEGTSNRTHHGFIAQDIEELLTTLNIPTQDFAAYIKWQEIEDVFHKDGTYEATPIPNTYSYGLRYEELIAPLVKVVQLQQQEIDTLKTQLKLITEE